MNIAVLGGSFDPPHFGHRAIAMQILEFLPIDEVLLVPLYKHPFEKNLSKASDRFTMAEFLQNDKIKVSDIEILKKSTSYSVDTLQTLAKRYKNHKFYWVIGSDQVKDFPKWKNWQEIIEKFHLIIFPRVTDYKKIEDEIKKSWKLKTIPKSVVIINHENLVPSNISSSDIRSRRKHKKPIAQLVPPEIFDYIDKRKLYQ